MSLYKPLGDLPSATNSSLLFYTSWNKWENYFQSELRTGGATSANPAFQACAPSTKVTAGRSQCSKRADASIRSMRTNKDIGTPQKQLRQFKEEDL